MGTRVATLTFSDGSRLHAGYSTVTGAMRGPAVGIDEEQLITYERADDRGDTGELDAYIRRMQDARDAVNAAAGHVDPRGTLRGFGDFPAAFGTVEICIASIRGWQDYDPWWAAVDKLTGTIWFGHFADAFGDGCAEVERLIGHESLPPVHTVTHALEWAGGDAAKAAAKLASEGVPPSWTPGPVPTAQASLNQGTVRIRLAAWLGRRLTR